MFVCVCVCVFICGCIYLCVCVVCVCVFMTIFGNKFELRHLVFFHSEGIYITDSSPR